MSHCSARDAARRSIMSGPMRSKPDFRPALRRCKEIDRGIAERVGSLTAAVMDDSARLRREVEQLKKQSESNNKGPVP